MPERSTYSKPFLTTNEHIALLRRRGLLIEDEEMAAHYLRFIGYYRLSGYTRFFQTQPDHLFKPGVSFENVLDLYNFDRKIRLLFLDAIERIEIAVRAVMTDTLSEQHGSHWYLERSAFSAEADHPQILMKLQAEMGYGEERKREVFIQHYLKTYADPPFPPGWMVFETLSLGTVSVIYASLALGYRKGIATKFELQHDVLRSVLHSLSYLRNLCAHHSRVWNRSFRIKPKIPKEVQKTYRGTNDCTAVFVAIIEYLLARIAPRSDWRAKFDGLLAEHPEVSRASMGL